MKRFKLNFNNDPSFNTVMGLTNTSFNSTNYMENRMATEEQISELYNRVVEQEQRRNKCCRDIIIWEARVQIVRLNTNTIVASTSGIYATNAGGIIVSNWDENVNIGIMRRGLNYTVTFPLKWDDNLYVKRHTSVNRTYGGDANGEGSGGGVVKSCNPILPSDYVYENQIVYMYGEDSEIIPTFCNITTSNRSGFMMSGNADMITTKRYGVKRCNLMSTASIPDVNWYYFIHDIKDDGTVTITDTRRNTDYNIIRYYTQWTLNRCADGSLLSDTLTVKQDEGPWGSSNP